MLDIAYKLISKVSRFVVSGFEITEVYSLLVWLIVVSFTMYMVMGIWLKDWVDLTSCHCFPIGFGIMSNLSVTWGGRSVLTNKKSPSHVWNGLCWLVIAWSLVTQQAFIFHSYLDLCQDPNSEWWKAVISYLFIHLHSGFVWKAILILVNLFHHDMTLVLNVIKHLRISQPIINEELWSWS